MADDKSLNSKIWTAVFVFIGVIMLGLHVGLFFYNKDIFNIVVSAYIIAYAIIFLVYIQKKKQYQTNQEYNFLTYTSLFVLCLEIIILIISLVSYFNKPGSYSKTPRFSTTPYRYGRF